MAGDRSLDSDWPVTLTDWTRSQNSVCWTLEEGMNEFNLGEDTRDGGFQLDDACPVMLTVIEVLLWGLEGDWLDFWRDAQPMGAVCFKHNFFLHIFSRIF